ncbi:MAG TPA: carboxyl transferase domain-containing protein [bacterium]|nr:carboxyl transferase domain-containing protein [bacterium]
MPPILSLTPQIAQGLGLATTHSLTATPLAMSFDAELVQAAVTPHLADPLIADRLGQERVRVLRSMVAGESPLDEAVVHQHLSALVEVRTAIGAASAPAVNPRGSAMLQAADGKYYRFGEGPGVRNVQRVFIPNRGVAAMSAIRYLRAMEEKYGVRFEIAVPYVDADLREPWIRMADIRVPIPRDPGDGPISCFKHPDQRNKKDIPRMINAARSVNADAIVPMWGFRSEDEDFVRAVEEAGLLFVGPGSAAMKDMGHKRNALLAARKAGLDVGEFSEILQSLEQAGEEARKLGFPEKPLMLKDVGGGGGTGNRKIRTWEELKTHVSNFLRDGKECFFEHLLTGELRHIEFQIVGDRHGHSVCFGFRDCTWQRRDQKVFELTATEVSIALLWEQYEKLNALTRAIGYVGAGTYEFIAFQDAQGQWRLKFMEMNTRLQVEHTITNVAYEVDLFEEMMLASMGYPLRRRQGDVVQKNVAIEARILAENAQFTPQTGRIAALRVPKGRRIITHTAVSDGSEITSHFDSMIDQAVSWEVMPPFTPGDVDAYLASMRAAYEGARVHMRRALGEYRVTGLQTNVPLLMRVLDTDEFRSNRLHLGTLTDKFGAGAENAGAPTTIEVGNALIAAAATLYKDEARNVLADLYDNRATAISASKIPDPLPRVYKLKHEDRVYDVVVSRVGLNALNVSINGVPRSIESSYIGNNHLITFDNQVVNTDVSPTETGVTVQIGGKNIRIEQVIEEVSSGARAVKTPMPGKLLFVVPEGTLVHKGQKVAVVEAMKMENEIQAETAGRVTKVAVEAGDNVAQDDSLMTIVPEGAAQAEAKKGEEGVDFQLPEQASEWLRIAGANGNGIEEAAERFRSNFDSNIPVAMQFFKAFFLGYDVVPAHADRMMQVLSEVLSEHSIRPKMIAEYLDSFMNIYLQMRRLTQGGLKRELLRLWHSLGAWTSFEPTAEFARIVVDLFREYGISVEMKMAKDGELDAIETLSATLKAHPGATRKALLQVQEAITWGLADRQKHLTPWVRLAAVWGDRSLSGRLQEVWKNEPWNSPLKHAAMVSLNQLDLAGYQKLVPPPVDNAYAESYERITKAPLASFQPDQIEAMRASLKAPFDDNPFRDLPRSHVDTGDLKRHYVNFNIRRLPTFGNNTAAFELVSKDPEKKNDRRILAVSWVNQEIRFNYNERGEIDEAPVVERAYIDSIRVIAAYKALEDPKDAKTHHHANRPVVFAIGQNLPWNEEDTPRSFSPRTALKVAENIYRFGDNFSAFSTRIFVDLILNGIIQRKILRFYLEDGHLLLKLTDPSEDVAEPRTDLELKSMQQRARGKLLAEERLNLLYGPGNWEESRLEAEGWDQPGENSAIRLAMGVRKGRRVFSMAGDFRVDGGTVDRAVGEKMAWITRRAREARGALVKIWDSGGARVQSGIAGLDGAGSEMRDTTMSRHWIPIVNMILGPCAGMAAYTPSVSEGPVVFVRGIKPRESIGNMFLTGADIVREVKGLEVTNSDLGGADPHMKDTGVGDVAFDTEEQAFQWTGAYLDFLAGDDFDPPAVAAYDVGENDHTRQALRDRVDGGKLIELKPEFGSVITALGRINGRNVGIISNYADNWEEMSYKSLRKMSDFMRLCRNLGIPVVKDQRSPWLYGDRMQDDKLARWSDKVDRLSHEVRTSGRALQYSILYPGRREFDEGHANASSDVVIAVLGEGHDPKVANKVRGYADFVVGTEEEAFQTVGLLETVFGSPERPTEDRSDRKSGDIFNWVLPSRSEEPFDMRKIIQGGEEFQVTKYTTPSQIDDLFVRMTGFPVPRQPNGELDFTVHDSRREAEQKDEWNSMTAQNADRPCEFRAYVTEEGKLAVQFRMSGRRLEGVFDVGASFVEYKSDFAGNALVGWTYLNGGLRGVVANQPLVRAGVADKDSSEKVEQFKRLCAKLGIKLVNLVIMPGFEPGDEEIIDIGGQLLISEVEYPEAEATLTVEKNTGGGYIERSSKNIRGFVVSYNGQERFIPFNYNAALPSALIMVMGAKGAVKIVKEYKTAIAKAPKEEKAQVQKEIERRFIEEVANPRVALAEGSIDEIVSFDDARAHLIAGIQESDRRIRQARDYQALERAVGEIPGIVARVGGDGLASQVQGLLRGALLMHLRSLGLAVEEAELALLQGFLKSQEPPEPEDPKSG